MAALQDSQQKGLGAPLDQPLAGQRELERLAAAESQRVVIVLGSKWHPCGRHGIALHRAEA